MGVVVHGRASLHRDNPVVSGRTDIPQLSLGQALSVGSGMTHLDTVKAVKWKQKTIR